MHHGFASALRAVWSFLLLYWIVSARNVKQAERTEPLLKRLVFYWLPLALAVYLLGPGDWFGHGALREQFVPHSTPVESIGLTLCIAGALLACYARFLLGRNWSGVVQLKADHELIQRGPYRVIRHPIYTGLLLLILGNAIMAGDWRGLLAVAIVFASFWYKLHQEERWLTQRFGRSYTDYRARTKALVPGVL